MRLTRDSRVNSGNLDKGWSGATLAEPLDSWQRYMQSSAEQITPRQAPRCSSLDSWQRHMQSSAEQRTPRQAPRCLCLICFIIVYWVFLNSCIFFNFRWSVCFLKYLPIHFCNSIFFPPLNISCIVVLCSGKWSLQNLKTYVSRPVVLYDASQTLLSI